jgi:hypothetical protein
VAVDALGRYLPAPIDCPIRPNKTIGMFYFMASGHHGTDGPYDITKLLAENPDNPQYAGRYTNHWWGEPEEGYFLATDRWVIRRNLSMIADAGIDTLIFDVSNAFTYEDTYIPLCEIAEDMKSKGEPVPKLCFMTWSASPDTAKKLYDDFYSKGLYPDLWLQWQGKPLMLGKPEDTMRDGAHLAPAIKDFFTWRETWFEPAGFHPGKDKWTWGGWNPVGYGFDTPGIPEELSVSVATHPIDNRGRSWHDNAEPPRDKFRLCKETPLGLSFDEQWKHAFAVDPQFVFVTGWNEWQASRFLVGQPGVANPQYDAPVPQFTGYPTKPGDSYFVDEYNEEYSRDIEPMRAGHSDDYYYQLIANVRRFKGARTPPLPGRPKHIDIHGRFDQWNDVTPTYFDTVGDTAHRDSAGWGHLHYTDDTGRNDFARMKIAEDPRFITFLAETKDPITPPAPSDWMTLFLDTDQDPTTGWNGYDIAINRAGATSDRVTVERALPNGQWKLVGTASYRREGNQLMIQVPRNLIGQARSREASFDFKWADNVGGAGDISNFFLHGDVAPNRRFNYRYSHFTAGPCWTFASDSGQWNLHNFQNATYKDGVLKANASAADAEISGPRYPSIDADHNDRVLIRMSTVAGNVATLRWTLNEDGSEGEQSFPIKADGQEHEYRIQVSKNPKWHGWVNSIRLNPGDRVGHIELRSIKIRSATQVGAP